MLRIIMILIVLSLLSACVTPLRLGISESEWGNFSAEEKEKIKKGYYDIQKKKLQSKENVLPDGSLLHVKIYGGKINLPPFSAKTSYTPIEFDIQSGSTRTLTLRDQTGTQKISMEAAYQHGVLFLDPSRYDPEKREGSIQLHYSPIWNRGFTYDNISSTGYVHLSNVSVSIKKTDHDEEG